MTNSEPPSQEPVVQPPINQTATTPLQCCPVCEVTDLPERIAVHTCNKPAPTRRSAGQRVQGADDPTRTDHSREHTTARLQRCADTLKPISTVQSTAIRTDNPHVNRPVLEIVVGPDEPAVPPRVLQRLAAAQCGLRGLHTRAQPTYWVLEAIAMPREQSPPTHDQVQ